MPSQTLFPGQTYNGFLGDWLGGAKNKGPNPVDVDIAARRSRVGSYLDGTGGSARQLSADLTNEIKGAHSNNRHLGDLALQGGLQEAASIRDRENADMDRMQGFLQGEFDATKGGGITDAEIEMLFGQSVDQANRDAMEIMNNLRERYGASGIRGGALTGLMADIQLGRLGQLTGASRDLSVYRAQDRTAQNARRYQQALQLGQFGTQGRSATLLDQLNNVAGVRLTQEGERNANKTAEKAARDAKTAGIVSGGLGFLGGLF